MDKKTIFNLSKKYSSFYLYDESQILSNISQLHHAFPNIKLLYSIKSNSNQEVLKTIFNNNLGADAASINEVFMAQKLGLSRNNIFYSAPGKSSEDINQGLKNSTLIADSINELRKINEIGKCNHTIYKIGVRINPNFSFNDELGYPSKFGIDEDKLFQLFNENTLNSIKIIGIHIHLKSQELSTKKLSNYYQNVILLALQVQKRLRSPLTFINMGSGIGVPYRSTDNPVNITLLGKRLSSLLSRFHSQLVNTKIIIESGRYLTCNAGTYVTRVLDRKVSHEQTFLILSNTLNGFIRPSLAMLINKYNNHSISVASEPLFTTTNAFKFTPLPQRPVNKKEKVTLVGNLCTTTDIIAENLIMPYLRPGDVIAISNAGAYGAVLSPMQFSSHNDIKEFLI